MDPVHRRVVALEMRDVDAREHDAVERAAGTGEHELQIVHDAAGLRFDAVGQRRAVIRGTVTAAGSIALLTLAFVVYLRVGADFTTRYATSGLAAIVLFAGWLFLANALVLIGYTAALEC